MTATTHTAGEQIMEWPYHCRDCGVDLILRKLGRGMPGGLVRCPQCGYLAPLVGWGVEAESVTQGTWAELMRRLRHALRVRVAAVILTPPTPEEADAAMAGAEEYPMSEEEIQRIADNVTQRATKGPL